jgi:hypothetical protein
MISRPVTYPQDFRTSFFSQNWISEETWKQCQTVTLTAVSLLSLHRPLRKPLMCGMSAVRAISHFTQLDGKDYYSHLLHGSLSTATVGLFFFSTTLGLLLATVSDLIANANNLIEHATKGEKQEALKSVAFLILDILFLATLCHRSLEMAAACILMQIVLDIYLSAEHLYNGNYLEAACQATLAAARLHKSAPLLERSFRPRDPNAPRHRGWRRHPLPAKHNSEFWQARRAARDLRLASSPTSARV